MAKYLGETTVGTFGPNFPHGLEETPFRDFTAQDWAMYYIERYGSIDGGHHKQWVLDQVARILNGTTIHVVVAKWDDGREEYRVSTDRISEQYIAWVRHMEDECHAIWDEGTTP